MRASVSLLGSFLVVFLLMVTAVWAVPDTINYQGILTDEAGIALSGDYQITFRLFDAADETGMQVWSEIQTVTVSGGIYNVQLGASTFLDSVDFSAPYWLEVAVGGETLSPRQALTSVPYAMRAQYADGVAANTNFSLGTQWISGDGDDEGVFVDSDGHVGVGVDPTSANLEVAGDNGVLFGGTYGQGSIPAEGVGTRLMWYPGKAAFRSGYTTYTQWDDVNIGGYSVAMGYSTTASGGSSTAMGSGTTASGGISTAMGYQTTASGDSSTAMGEWTVASGLASTAMGRHSKSSGWFSTAMGIGSQASGSISTAIGDYSKAYGIDSIALGRETKAYSFNETVVGSYNTYYNPVSTDSWDISDRLFVIGNGTIDSTSDAMIVLKSGDTTINGALKATSFNGAMFNAVGTTSSGEYSTAMGFNSTASGENSTALGRGTTASGFSSTATGYYSAAINDYSTAMGDHSTASGGWSTAMGAETTASGLGSTAMGLNTTAESHAETTLGRYDTNYTPISLGTWNIADRLFVIGNGTADDARSDAMVVLKSGDTTINGDMAVNGALDINGQIGSNGLNVTGNLEFGTGADRHITLADPTRSLFIGGTDTTNSPWSIWMESSGYLGYVTNDTERMRITNAGRVGIGTNNPSTLLHVAGTITEDSDLRLKENITPIDSALYKIGQLEGVSFNWRDQDKYDKHDHLGVIAQQVEGVFPEVVFTADDERGTKSVDYNGLIAPLIEAVKELKVQSENIQAQNLQLQRQNSALQALICLDHPTAPICQ